MCRACPIDVLSKIREDIVHCKCISLTAYSPSTPRKSPQANHTFTTKLRGRPFDSAGEGGGGLAGYVESEKRPPPPPPPESTIRPLTRKGNSLNHSQIVPTAILNTCIGMLHGLWPSSYKTNPSFSPCLYMKFAINRT